MIPVKVCGITSRRTARLAADLGTSALGFIFYPGSPRYVSPDEAQRIARVIPSGVAKVGVFVNETVATIRKIAQEVGLDFIQLHGDEDSAMPQEMPLPVIRVVRVKNGSVPRLPRAPVHAFLLDTYSTNEYGGTGISFDWRLARQIVTDRPFILAGGLGPSNVVEAIIGAHPDAIDVNSGVEVAPGKKDPSKLRAFFERVGCIPDSPNIFNSSYDRRASNDP